jgi:hypothetical protein
MTLDEFLERFIEGYLFCDLRSMAPIRVRDGDEYGGVGYPMVMSALSGIELLGALTSDKTFSRWSGSPGRFQQFWAEFMYPQRPKRSQMGSLIYELVRNGLAHTCITKPMVVVTKSHDGAHLCRTADGSIVVDALTLADELVAAYEERVKPRLLESAFRDKMEGRFRELRREYQKEYADKKTAIDLIPLVAETWRPSSPPLIPNSPSVPTVYSTNVTHSQAPFKPK